MSKVKYYVLILVLLLVVGFLVMFSYYTQDFSVRYVFNDEVDYGDFETSDDYQWDALVGKVKLSNDGFFQERYKAPSLVACFEYADDSTVNNLNPMRLRYDFENRGYNIANAEGLHLNYNFEVPIAVGDDYSVDIYATIQRDIFQKQGLKVVAANVYEVPEKERNPISYEYRQSSNYLYSCNDVKADLKPIGEIAYNWAE